MTENGEESNGGHRPRPLQFGLAALFGVTAAVALLFGTLRWFGVPARTSGLVLLILLVSVVAAVGLVVAVAAAMDQRGP
jgi:hypothetical protein